MRAYSPCSNERYSLKEINAIVLHGIKMLLLVLDALDSEISEKNNERITLSQFFAENEMIELTPDTKELLDHWSQLSPAQKEATLIMLRTMTQK